MADDFLLILLKKEHFHVLITSRKIEDFYKTIKSTLPELSLPCSYFILKNLRFVQEDKNNLPWVMSFLNIPEYTEKNQKNIWNAQLKNNHNHLHREAQNEVVMLMFCQIFSEILIILQPNMTHCYKCYI